MDREKTTSGLMKKNCVGTLEAAVIALVGMKLVVSTDIDINSISWWALLLFGIFAVCFDYFFPALLNFFIRGMRKKK